MQNPRALRRLAADHGNLHNELLPPNFLFVPNLDNDDLTQLDILLVGPIYTPFSAGVFKLHLTIPDTYPQQPPTAFFRTPIFHPNVDPQTGGVCVETLKRDWDTKLTLRDILIVISCLLIQPNPDSALNAEAGSLIQEDYQSFERRAQLMTGIHATIPKDWREAVKEAQNRGNENPEVTIEECVPGPAAPTRRRRPVARSRPAPTGRRSEGSPTAARQRRQVPSARAFVVSSLNDDVFGETASAAEHGGDPDTRSQEDDSMVDDDQENDEARSPAKGQTPPLLAATPRRPHRAAVPLGELIMDDPPLHSASSCDDDDTSDTELEYPPSPSKSPSKSAAKRPQRRNQSPSHHAESSRDAAQRGNDITPPNIFDKPLARDSPYVTIGDQTPSPRKARIQHRPTTPAGGRPGLGGGLFGDRLAAKETPGRVIDLGPRRGQQGAGITKRRSPTSSEKKRSVEKRRAQLDAKLWKLCGEDIQRWNRGDFDGQPFKKKAPRW